MNKHTKMALFVAPILIMGGYILSDLYIERQADKTKYFELSPEGFCDILNGNCILSSGDFRLNVYDESGRTWVNSNFQLDRVTLFLVDEDNNPTEIKMAMGDNPFYWWRNTKLRQYMPNQGDTYKLRVVAEIKGGKYFTEFYSQRSA